MRKVNLGGIINPVYKKELKTSVRSMRIALTIMGYNAILAIIGLLTYYLNIQSDTVYGFDNSSILAIYSIIAIIEFGLILFAIPAFTSGTVSGERERQTLEILLTTKLTPGQIIRGKLVSSISTLILLVFSSLPVLALVFTIGGIGIGDLAQIMLIAVITAVFAGSFGIFFSTLFKRTMASTIFTYGMVVVLTLGTLAVMGIAYAVVDKWQYTQYYSGAAGGYGGADLGMFICILLLNPVISFASMLCSQLGSAQDFVSFIDQFGTLPVFLKTHWFVISMAVQLIVGCLVLLWAGRLLNPLKRRTKIKK